MKKYVKADAMSDFDTLNKIGDAETIMYEMDAEKALFDFKDCYGYQMSRCGEDLIIKEGDSVGYYTVLPDVFGGYQIINDYADEDDRIRQMLDDGMTEFEILIDYITTESPDADDFDMYFAPNREYIDTLLELIQYEAKRCGWD